MTASVEGIDYVSIPVPEEEWNPYRTGVRVQIRGDWEGIPELPDGTRGTVIGWGRGIQTNTEHAELTRRVLFAAANEHLIDSEGPIVAFDNEISDWFPSQAITPLAPISADPHHCQLCPPDDTDPRCPVHGF
jgi:hypothetical protein